MLLTCLLVCVGLGLFLIWPDDRDDDDACRITEEWCGSFIGRRYCSTHDVHWDGGGEHA